MKQVKESAHCTINITPDNAKVTLIGSETGITSALLAALGTHIDNIAERDEERADEVRRIAVKAITERVV